MSGLSTPYMQDEAAAFVHVETMLWADGPVCPHCGVVDRAYRFKGIRTKSSNKDSEGKEPDVTKKPTAGGGSHKMKVLTLVDRDTKSIVVDDLKKSTLIPILCENISREAFILTDEARQYQSLATSADFSGHDWVNHNSEEYVHREALEVHTNTVECFYSIFKRGIKGVYQHCGKQHLHRYAAKFDLRYNNNHEVNGVNDAERASVALSAVVGKRALYRDSSGVQDPTDRSSSWPS